MKNIMIVFVILTSFSNSVLIIDSDLIIDSVINNFKNIRFTTSKKQNDNCIKEYEKLMTRNEKELKIAKIENDKLRYLAKTNQISFEEIDKSTDLKVRYNKSCSIQYYDYFKLSNKQISDLKKENIIIKRMLTERNIFYQPILKTNIQSPVKFDSERSAAKEKLRLEMIGTGVTQRKSEGKVSGERNCIIYSSSP